MKPANILILPKEFLKTNKKVLTSYYIIPKVMIQAIVHKNWAKLFRLPEFLYPGTAMQRPTIVNVV